MLILALFNHEAQRTVVVTAGELELEEELVLRHHQ